MRVAANLDSLLTAFLHTELRGRITLVMHDLVLALRECFVTPDIGRLALDARLLVGVQVKGVDAEVGGWWGMLGLLLMWALVVVEWLWLDAAEVEYCKCE